MKESGMATYIPCRPAPDGRRGEIETLIGFAEETGEMPFRAISVMLETGGDVLIANKCAKEAGLPKNRHATELAHFDIYGDAMVLSRQEWCDHMGTPVRTQELLRA
jgi:hypothetical protein